MVNKLDDNNGFMLIDEEVSSGMTAWVIGETQRKTALNTAHKVTLLELILLKMRSNNGLSTL